MGVSRRYLVTNGHGRQSLACSQIYCYARTQFSPYYAEVKRINNKIYYRTTFNLKNLQLLTINNLIISSKTTEFGGPMGTHGRDQARNQDFPKGGADKI